MAHHHTMAPPTTVETLSSQITENDERIARKYTQEKVVGNGSFGVVYQSTEIATHESVAIKTVLQDRRYKNRELQIMQSLSHPNVVTLKDFFYHQPSGKEEVFLNVVMEFIPDTIYRAIRNNAKEKTTMPMFLCKVYTYQMFRSLAYCRRQGICHRDIKPQNLLLNSETGIVKLCDFGSAKKLVGGQPNVAYICSRYYRAPELIFGSTDYSLNIDIWSMGCVVAEMFLSKPIFPGESGVDQLVEIIKVLGTPSREEILAMNPNYTEFKFPQVKPYPWAKVFRTGIEQEAIDLIQKLLKYRPKERIDPFQALADPFFDDLRLPGAKLPNGAVLPPLFNFTSAEVTQANELGILSKLTPATAP